jgi:hypothetical protein
MEDEALRAALAPTGECLAVEQLGRYADGALGAGEQSAADRHLAGCLTCQAELALLHAVTSSGVRDSEAEMVRNGVRRLDQRSAEILGDRASASPPRRWFRVGTFPPPAVAAVLLVGIAAGTFFALRTRNAPDLPSRVTTGDEVTRSLAVTVSGPVGDQRDVPQRFEWAAVAGAVRYRVRLMEVDRRELWSTSTASLALEPPQPIRTSIVPGRTLLWDVTAYGAAGAAIAESGTQSFRVLPR